MAQYDVYAGRGEVMLLDVQAEALAGLNTRVVIPLMRPEAAPLPARQLNPALIFNQQTYLLMTQFMSAIPAFELRERLGTVKSESHRVSLALDLLLHGI
jgi:toxin CcdB